VLDLHISRDAQAMAHKEIAGSGKAKSRSSSTPSCPLLFMNIAPDKREETGGSGLKKKLWLCSALPGCVA